MTSVDEITVSDVQRPIKSVANDFCDRQRPITVEKSIHPSCCTAVSAAIKEMSRHWSSCRFRPNVDLLMRYVHFTLCYQDLHSFSIILELLQYEQEAFLSIRAVIFQTKTIISDTGNVDCFAKYTDDFQQMRKGWLKMTDTKMTDHQNCWTWNFRTWNCRTIKCRTKNAVLTEITLHYNEVHKCLLLVYPLDTNIPMHCVYVTMYVEKS